MTRVRWNWLPGHKTAPKPRAARPAPAAWRCRTCGEVLYSWAAAERHADGHGGARLDLLLDPEDAAGQSAP